MCAENWHPVVRNWDLDGDATLERPRVVGPAPLRSTAARGELANHHVWSLGRRLVGTGHRAELASRAPVWRLSKGLGQLREPRQLAYGWPET